MDRIMVEICLSRPMKKWMMVVSLSLNLTLLDKFSNSLIYSWNPLLGVLPSSLPGFWNNLDMSQWAFILVLKGLKFWLKSTLNLAEIFSSALTSGLAILSYHFSEKATPFPIFILLRIRTILSSLEV